MRWKGWKIKK